MATPRQAPAPEGSARREWLAAARLLGAATDETRLLIDEPTSHLVDYDNTSITENTRGSYILDTIPNAKLPALGGHPKNVIFLTADAFGVLPPVSKLTPAQAMYHYISGYTAKVAGTEVGVKDPEPTFSPCFGGPFLVWHPTKYAEMLADRLKKHNAQTWLVNTGWSGGPYGIGARIKIVTDSKTQMDEVRSGDSYLSHSDWRLHFGLAEARAVEQVEIQWPNGSVEKLKNLPINQTLILTEGKGWKPTTSK